MELGIGLGAFLSAMIYSNDPSRFFTTFLISGLLGAMAFLYLLRRPQLVKA
jgi:predicted MFS family arabinose efflux permease